MRPLPELIKHVGRGVRLARELPEDEAEAAMRALVSGEADAVQTGAFLLAMRMKGESAGELAGFVRALRGAAHFRGEFELDVDLHGDGREGRPSVALAAACLVAALGTRVLLRGWFGSRHARNDLGETFERLVPRGSSGPVVILDLDRYAPRVAALLALREKIGVRTCVHSAVKLLDPTATGHVACGIFHSPYHEPMAGALQRLGVVRYAVVQGPGGLPEVAPDKPTRVTRAELETLAPTTNRPPEPALDAGALAELLGAVLAGKGPPGATAMTLATATLWRWVATGRDEPEAVAAALRDGAAAAILQSARLCYGDA